MYERGNELTASNNEGSELAEPHEQVLTKEEISLDADGIIEDIRTLLEKDDNPSQSLQEYLSKVEQSIKEEKKKKLEEVDREHLKSLIEKHPFFKNPNNYYIRLVTIMKYLKKKGVDISLDDMDLVVDEVILSIDGVKKRGYGQYSRHK